MKKVQENPEFLHFFLCPDGRVLNRESDLDLVFGFNFQVFRFRNRLFPESKSRCGLDAFLSGLIWGVRDLESTDFKHFTNKDKSLLMSKKSSTFAAEFRSEFVRLV